MLAAILIAVCIVALLYFTTKPKPVAPPPPSYDWMKAGGTLGMLVMIARLTRVPLATLLTVLPFVISSLKQGESHQAHGAGGSAMTREEARLILGVATTASADDIKTAHRRLMQKNHPDTGGSDYLAAKINQARDVLLG